MWFMESATVIRQILLLTLDVQKPKSFQLQGLRPPDPLTRGSAPGPCWGRSPRTPVIGSRYRACHNPPRIFQIPPHGAGGARIVPDCTCSKP